MLEMSHGKFFIRSYGEDKHLEHDLELEYDIFMKIWNFDQTCHFTLDERILRDLMKTR